VYLDFCVRYEIVPSGLQARCPVTIDSRYNETTERITEILQVTSLEIAQCLLSHYRAKIAQLQGQLSARCVLPDQIRDLEQFCTVTFHTLSFKKIKKIARDRPTLRREFESTLQNFPDFTCFFTGAPVTVMSTMQQHNYVTSRPPVHSSPSTQYSERVVHTDETEPGAAPATDSNNPPLPEPAAADPVRTENSTPTEEVNNVPPLQERATFAHTLDRRTHSLGYGPSLLGHNIINPFNCTLTQTQVQVLSKGLSFCPTNPPDRYTIQRALSELERKLKLKAYYAQPDILNEGESSDTEPEVPAHPMADFHREIPSNKYFVPDKCDPKLTEYMKVVRTSVAASLTHSLTRPTQHNLSVHERNALRSLRSNKTIVIKPSDKGSNIVILPASEYKQKCFSHLADPSTYEQISPEKFNACVKQVRNLIATLAPELDEKVFNYIKLKEPRPGTFYALMKTHKTGLPVRPIVSGIGSITEHCSHLLDHVIGPLACKLDTYVKDSDDFQSQIKELRVPADALLVTCDVESMYSKIPWEDGIQATVDAYTTMLTEPQRCLSPEAVRTLLNVVLKYNIFEFDGSLYLQKTGTAMGTKAAPSFATLFMGHFEQGFLETQELKPLFIKRFLDDIFFVWTHGPDALKAFLENMNRFNENIKLTHTVSHDSVNYLDMTISKSTDGSLATALYRKPTDTPAYLDFYSEHPKHTKQGLPFSVAIRIARRCTRNEDKERNLQIMRKDFLAKRYPPPLIDNAIAKARTRGARRTMQTSDSGSDNIVRLIVPYSSKNPRFQKILSDHFHLLCESSYLRQVFTEPPQVVFSRAPNLKGLLVHSRLTTTDSRKTGSGPCNGRSDCQVCAYMKPTKYITSRNQSFRFEIRGNYHCNSHNIVYVLACGTCEMQYVGHSSTKFRLRFNNHKVQKNQPILRHVQTTGHELENFSAYIVKGSFKSEADRRFFESFMIHKLDTVNTGLNEDTGDLPIF
jgi:hypothetical protein